MRQGFLFDLNKCVGCHACVIACQIENHEVQSGPWRRVTTFNAFQFLDLPLFHLSLACNHCDDPLCLTNCPARAYTRDAVLHTIDLHEDLCIGCRYCTWACPYDAPKFILPKGVVEKCTMCKSRLAEELKPNCANLCPTGALDFGPIGVDGGGSVPGFPEKGLGPAITLVPLRKRVIHSNTPSQTSESQLKSSPRVTLPASKVSLRQEWTLAVFTLLSAVLVGLFASAVTGAIHLDPLPFLGAGVMGMVLSANHLGRPIRAWRAILNVRSSWLSREVVAYTFFLVAAAGSFLFDSTTWLGVAGIILGAVALIAMDMVYGVAAQRPLPALHSASGVLTGLFLFSALIGIHWLFILLACLKFAYYMVESFRDRERPLSRLLLSVVRVVIGLLLPLVFLAFSGEAVLTGVFLLIGESINRAEFYADLEIVTPAGEMARVMKG